MKIAILNKYQKSKFLSLLISLCFFSGNLYSQSLIDASKIINEKVKIRDEETPKLDPISEYYAKKTSVVNETKKDKKTKSIMFTDDEMEKVQAAMDSFLNGTNLEEGGDQDVLADEDSKKTSAIQIKKQSRIYLNAILYVSRNNWIAWVNGEKITSESNNFNNSIYIKSIDRNKAAINWKMGITKWKALTGEKEIIDPKIYKINQETNQVEMNFTLKTNQTYNLTDNLIADGKMDKITEKQKTKTVDKKSSESQTLNSDSSNTKNYDSKDLNSNLSDFSDPQNNSELSIDSIIK